MEANEAQTKHQEQEEVAERGWLSPDGAIEYTGIARTRLYRLLTSGEIPSAKLGRTRHIRRCDLDAFLEAHKTGK